MKTLIVTLAIIIGSISARAGEHKCQKAADRQNGGLAEESSGELASNAYAIEFLKNEANTIEEEEAAELISLLSGRRTIAFFYSNDAGAWISIVDSRSCRVITTIKILDI